MKNQIAEILKVSGNKEAFPIVEITLCRSLDVLRPLMSKSQFSVLADMVCNSEEKDFFKSVAVKLAGQLLDMPKLYATDGKTDAVFPIHLFTSSLDFWIKELDLATGEAFGLIKQYGDTSLGYFNLNELRRHAEFDFHFEPATREEIEIGTPQA